MVQGSEETLFSGAKDSLSQAAHSMRDCFEKVIRELAPSECVKVQPWFLPTPEASDEVSRRSRLRYMLYGSGENIDQLFVKRLDDLAGFALNSLNICIGSAHNHELNATQDQTRLVIDNARYELLIILEAYNSRIEK